MVPWTRHKTGKDGYVVLTILEHRHVMEEHLGRALRRNEHVHHLNGVKDDNRIENLRVMEIADHARLTAKNNPFPNRKRGRAPATCHPDRPLCAKGLCKPCYYREYMRKMREEQPEVVAEWKRRERERDRNSYKREWRAKRKADGLPYI